MSAYKHQVMQEALPKEWFLHRIIIQVFNNNLIFSLQNEADITPQLEQSLKELGLKLTCDFKSPCG